MDSIDLNKVNYFVMHKQHLAHNSQINDVIQITKDICGLHATGTKEPYLALFARNHNFTKEQLDNELRVRRTLGKIRCMRGTLYILSREMIPVAYAATKEMVEKLSRQYAEFRGVSANEYLDVSKLISDLLAGKEMTAAEIRAKLGTRLYLPAVLNLMCDQGLLVRVRAGSGWKDKNYKYALFKEYFKDVDLNLSEDDALVMLVRQYLESFGPATENDISWWTGLSKAKIREALGRLSSQTTLLSISGLEVDFIILHSDLDLIKKVELTSKHTVNLLPTLDPYLMGYKQRNRYLNYDLYDKIFDRSGNAASTVLIDGKIAGIWDLSGDAEAQLKLFLFEEVSDEMWQQICARAQEMGQFISEHKVEIKRVSSMTPLTQRTAGAFMSPLKNGME